MTRLASIALILSVCVSTVVSAQQNNAVQTALPTASRFENARLLTRTGGRHSDETDGALVSDPGAKQLRFEADDHSEFEVGYDRITDLHSESGPKYPHRLLNRQMEFFLTIHFLDADNRDAVRSILLDKESSQAALDRVESDTGLTVEVTEPRRSFLGLPIRVAVGDTVIVRDRAGHTVKGKLTGLSRSSLVLDGTTSAGQRFDERDIARIRLPYSPKHDAVVGFVTGAAAIGGVELLVCGGGGCSLTDVLGPPVILGGIMAGINVTVDALLHSRDTAADVYIGQ